MWSCEGEGGGRGEGELRPRLERDWVEDEEARSMPGGLGRRLVFGVVVEARSTRLIVELDMGGPSPCGEGGSGRCV